MDSCDGKSDTYAGATFCVHSCLHRGLRFAAGESETDKVMSVSPPSANQMMKDASYPIECSGEGAMIDGISQCLKSLIRGVKDAGGGCQAGWRHAKKPTELGLLVTRNWRCYGANRERISIRGLSGG